MKLEHIIQGLESGGLNVLQTESKTYTSTLKITDYIKVVVYHDKHKNVDQMNVFAVVVEATATHYQDVINLIDKCTNFMSDLTQDLRVSMFKKISLGEINDIKFNLDDLNVEYKLNDDGLLVYKIIDNRA